MAKNHPRGAAKSQLDSEQYANYSDAAYNLRQVTSSDRTGSAEAGFIFAPQGSQYPNYSRHLRAWPLQSQDFRHISAGTPYPSYESIGGNLYAHSDVGSPERARHNPLHVSASPSTPQSTANSDVGNARQNRRIQARNNIVLGNKSRVAKSPKLRKAKPARGENKKKLVEPLSVLTQHLTNVPVRDMDAWVHRSADERRDEVEKRKGYITRPMNSFMLYRSAYSERTKAWCSENNHQIVSAVSGESWPLEPPEIKNKYEELAKIERTNHQKAHPEYKFSPSKGTQAIRKKKDDNSDEEAHESDGDPEWTPSGRRRPVPASRNITTRIPQSNLDVPHHHLFPPNSGIAATAWSDYSNRSLPFHLGSQTRQAQYFYNPAYLFPAGDAHSEAHYSEASNAQPVLDHEQPLLGLPGQHDPGLFQFASTDQGIEYTGGQVDPKLLGQSNSDETTAKPEEKLRPEHQVAEGEPKAVYLPRYQEGDFMQEPWRNDILSAFDPSTEFDHWVT